MSTRTTRHFLETSLHARKAPRRRASFVVLAAFTLVASACTPVAAPAATPTLGTPSAPKTGGTLTINTDFPIRNLDPARIQVTAERAAMMHVIQRLLDRDADNQLQPVLASSWRVEPDGRTWTLDLRRGVRFSDGTPFNAAAVISNFERWMDEKNTGRNMREMRLVFDSAEAVDAQTVRFKTKAVVPHALAHLSTQGAEIISPSQLQRGRFADEIDKAPVGTGPFKVESFIPGERLTFIRNDDYWGKRALLDKIVFLSIADASARTAALLTGQTDFAVNLPVSQLPLLRDKPGIQVLQFPALRQEWFIFNVRRPPLADPRVRIALNHAIDMEAVKNVVYEGLTVPFCGPINPTVFKPDPPVDCFRYEPQRARTLLQEAGIRDLRLRLVYHEATPTRYAELLQSQMRDVGVTLDLERFDRPKAEALKEAGDFDITSDAHGNGIRVAASVLSGTLHSGGHVARWTGYKNPAIDRLIEQALLELDDKKRSELLTELFREYMKAPPFIGTRGAVSVHAFSTRVKGFTPHPDLEMPLAGMWLDR